MHWAPVILLILCPLLSTKCFAQESDESESTTLKNNDLLDDLPSSSENVPSPSAQNPLQLDSSLRDALLKAITELETGDNNDSRDEFSVQNDEQNIERAQASAVTIVEEKDKKRQIVSSDDQEDKTKTNELQLTTTIEETVNNNLQNTESQETLHKTSNDASTENSARVIVQKSNGIQSDPITSIENEPLDFFKDAEQIITSASNSFITQGKQESTESVESSTQTSSFTSLNSINDFDSKTLSKGATIEDNFNDNAVDEPPFEKTYVKLLGNVLDNDIKPTEINVKASNIEVSSEKSFIEDTKSVENTDFGDSSGKGTKVETSTTAPVEVSTEESEAKVEQVQFFSAPLVAAFTVHQDEKGQPKKVVPIYKNDLNQKKQQSVPQQTENLQSPTFANLELQKKQQILELELEKLRNQQLLQQERVRSRHNAFIDQSFNSPTSNNLALTQFGFNQAINQNFNQFDPIFTEPDRSIVTKLAAIDPGSLLAEQNGLILNKFTPSEAISPITNPINPNSNPILKNTNNEVSSKPSVTYDPSIEAGKLPLNAQILPTKEPTGFLSFVPNSQNQQVTSQIHVTSRPFVTQSDTNLGPNNPSQTFIQPNSNFAQSNLNTFTQPQSLQQNYIRPSQIFQQPYSNNIYPSISNFVSSTGQSNGQIQQNSNFLSNQVIQTGLNSIQTQQNGLLKQDLSSLRFNNDDRGQVFNQNNQFLTSNRVLRQEQGSGNLGLNQNTFSIVPSYQPFRSTHVQQYFPDNNRFLIQNQEATLTQPQQFGAQTYSNNQNLVSQGTQSRNRYFRSNLEGSLTAPKSFEIQQSIQPFGQNIVNYSPQNTRFFRSNQESTLGSLQNVGFSQPLSFSQTVPNRFLRSNQESTVTNLQNLGPSRNLGSSQTQNYAPIYQNRFLRSNQESTLLNNQNRFLPQATLQNYKYSNPFGYRTVPL